MAILDLIPPLGILLGIGGIIGVLAIAAIAGIIALLVLIWKKM